MICIIDCGTSWLKEIKEHVKDGGHEYKVVGLEEIQTCDVASFSGIIISGAPVLLSHADVRQKFLALFERIKTVTMPVAGICLGHQIIGLLHGSEILRGATIDKQERIEIVRTDAIFSGIDNHSLFREEHSESITVPDEFTLLATSDTCANEAMRHTRKKMYGVQFHPEVSGENGKSVLKNFLNMCSQ